MSRYQELQQAQLRLREELVAERRAANEAVMAVMKAFRRYLGYGESDRTVAKLFDPETRKPVEGGHGFHAGKPGVDVNDAVSAYADGYEAGFTLDVRQPGDPDDRANWLGWVIRFKPVVDTDEHDVIIHDKAETVRIKPTDPATHDEVAVLLFKSSLGWFDLEKKHGRDETKDEAEIIEIIRPPF